MRKEFISSEFWLQFFVLLAAVTVVGLFITDSLLIRFTVFLDMNIGTEFMIDDREFSLWFILFLGILALICGLLLTHKRWLLVPGTFLWLVGMAFFKITLSYDKLICLHDNYIVYKEKERLSLLDAWGNPCTDFQFDAYLPLYNDNEQDIPAQISFVLFDNGSFYGFSHGEVFPAGQIRYRDDERYSEVDLLSWDNSLSYKDVYAYVIIDYKNVQPTYHFFNSYGVYIDSSSFFIIADDSETSEIVLQLPHEISPMMWRYYRVFDNRVFGTRFLRTDSPSHEKVYLSNIYSSNANALILASPIPWDVSYARDVPEELENDSQTEDDYNVSDNPTNPSNTVTCPVCHAQQANCGFCQGTGAVSPDMAAMMRHIMSGGSLNDFFPAGSGTTGRSGNQRNAGSPSSSRLCPTCGGKETCPVCGGSGEVINYGETSICNFCYAEGKCPTCMGEGRVPN